MTINKDWSWLDKITGNLDADFIAAVNEKSPQQERPTLDFFNERDPANQNKVDNDPG